MLKIKKEMKEKEEKIGINEIEIKKFRD